MHRTAGVPAALFIPLLIVVGFLPMGKQLMSANRHVYDILTLLLSMAGVGIFVGVLYVLVFVFLRGFFPT